jgi:hypothetical protein
MPHNVYLDESGDLGWKFTHPYRNGGSSRFLTIAFVITPITLKHLPKRIVKKVYEKYSFPLGIEVKGIDLTLEQKKYVCKLAANMVTSNPQIILGAITVKKQNVLPHIQQDGNKLYNYMIGLSVLNKINQHPTVNLIRDERSIKVASGNSCGDYLQIKLWFDLNSSTTLTDILIHSHECHNIMFIDWISSSIWSLYENGERAFFDILSPILANQKLFF